MADSLLSVSPLVEAELTRIDHILNNYGDGSCEAPAPQTLKGLKPCKDPEYLLITFFFFFLINFPEHSFISLLLLLLLFTSRLSSLFHRWGWCQDGGAGLESVWCDQSVPCSLPQVLLQQQALFGGPMLHAGPSTQAALHPDRRLQGAFVKRVRLPSRSQ